MVIGEFRGYLNQVSGVMLERGDFADVHVVISPDVILWLSANDPSVSSEKNHMPPVRMEVLISQRYP